MRVRNNLRHVLPAAAGIWLTIAASGFSVFAAEQPDETRFVEGTTINQVAVSGDTVEEAKNRIESYFQQEYELEIEDKDGNLETISGPDIQYQVMITEGLEEILAQENESGRQSGPGFNNSYQVQMEVSFQEDLLLQALNELQCVQEATPTTDAHISAYEEGKPFSIIPEVQGTELDMDRLTETVRTALRE